VVAMEEGGLSKLEKFELACVGADTSAFTWLARVLECNVCRFLRHLDLRGKITLRNTTRFSRIVYLNIENRLDSSHTLAQNQRLFPIEVRQRVNLIFF
jgi:hypothetical protein